MAKLALQAEGHELELMAAVEGLEGEEGWEPVAGKQAISSEPTMMSQEARNLFLNGDKQSGLAAWKVGRACWVAVRSLVWSMHGEGWVRVQLSSLLCTATFLPLHCTAFYHQISLPACPLLCPPPSSAVSLLPGEDAGQRGGGAARGGGVLHPGKQARPCQARPCQARPCQARPQPCQAMPGHSHVKLPCLELWLAWGWRGLG